MPSITIDKLKFYTTFNNSDDFLTKNIHLAVDKFRREHGFKKRKGGAFIKYNRYLTPGLKYLNPDQNKRLESNSILSLKPKSKINVYDQDTYNKLFNFDKNTTCLGNSTDLVNVLRSVYDLSFRYINDDKILLEKCRMFIIAYSKLFQLPLKNITTSEHIMPALDLYFELSRTDERVNKFQIKLVDQYNKIKPTDDPTGEEYKVLAEFAYFPPEYDQIDKLMSSFYDEYNHINNDENIFASPAWIIKTISDVHPLEDGNGRLARTIAFNLIGSKKNIIFTTQEIADFGKDPAYIKATSRGIKLGEMEAWLSSVVEKKQTYQKLCKPIFCLKHYLESTPTVESFFSYPKSEKLDIKRVSLLCDSEQAIKWVM